VKEKREKPFTRFFFVQPTNFTAKKVIVKPKYTIITKLDASNSEEHFRRIKKGHRYNISKALKEKHLKVAEDYTEKSLRSYYALLKETYAYNKFMPMPFQFYKDVITQYHKNGECKFLLALYKGKPIGTIVGITYKETLYYWTGGFLREHSQLYPNDLLQWELITWGYEKNMRIYDMLGGDIEGIRNFKLGFGGELVEYKKVYSGRKLYLLASLYSRFGMGLRNMLRRI